MSVCKLKVGVGKDIIKFPKNIFPIEKFSSVHDDINVRVLLIESNIDIAIISYELTSLRDYEIENIKNIVYNKTKISKENIWICVTHTFSVPHVRSEEALKKASDEVINKNKILCEELECSLNRALDRALKNKQDAKIGFGKGYCSVNVCRDMYTPSGWWLGSDDLGVSDKEIPIVKFDNNKGEPIAIIYSYDVQSSIMDGVLSENGTRLITGDLTGSASAYIEEMYDESFVAMYVVGAAGDQAPLFKAKQVFIDKSGNIQESDIGKNGFVLVNELGKRLADKVIIANDNITTDNLKENIEFKKNVFKCVGQVIPKSINEIKPKHKYEYIKDGEREVDLEIISLGEIAIVGIKPEISSISAIDIRKKSPFNLTMLFTMVNGGSKYMPDKTAYDRITYESMNSMFSKGSAEILVKEAVKGLYEIKNEKIGDEK